MRLTHSLAVLTATALFGLAGVTGVTGCKSNNNDNTGTPGMQSSAAAGELSSARLAADETPPPPGSPAATGAHAAPNAAQPALRYSLAYPTGNRQTSVLLLEADAPDSVRLGQPFRYTMRVTNLTDYPVQAVRVRDVGEETGTALTAHGTTRPANVEPITWDVGYLGPHQTQTKVVTGVGDVVGSIHNCLAVSYAPTLCTAIAVTKPELEITKEGPDHALICQDITYTYNVSNTGTGVAQNVRVTDTLPEGLTTADGKREVSFDAGNLAAGQSRQFKVQVKPAHTGEYASRAVARTGDVESQSRDLRTVISAPVLAVNVDGPESRYVNEPVDYRVTVRNTGDAPSENTVVRFTSSTGEAVPERNLGTLAPNDAKTFTITTRSGNAGGNLMLTASATGTCVQQAAQNQATVSIVTIPALRLGVVHSVDPVRVGHNTVYTISVANTGSGADKNAVVSATIPEGEEFVSGNGTTQVTANGRDVTFGPIATMNPGETATWNVEVKTTKAGDAAFHATLKSDTMTKAAEKIEPTRIVP